MSTPDAEARVEEGSCRECGERNPVWWASHTAWNLAVGGDASREAGGILCPTCFHRKWLGATKKESGLAEIRTRINNWRPVI